MIYEYKTRGTCSRKIILDIEDGVIKSAVFEGGCHGNTQGISKLVEGMRVDDVIARLEGVDCRGRGTSCPDQLAKALKEAKNL
ncbi:MAG: TIGR03905 family TSCPD domain-containing protein [Clostridia bacterium]|nr:TIGR03905 family TSCPD domain-containing protein [Clostridia bacterium]